MTDLSRGTRSRRGGRRPGWQLLTVLLVLAIGASSALVFTERVELLKLAVILALWAAVAAAFVSVIYRRQSDVDRAAARDLKLVYDLQLDREISARREYELEVESQLRRELASELRAESADEVAALRTELAALRKNLQILFDTDLGQRPALEPERTTVRAYSDWQRDRPIPDPPRPATHYSSAAPHQDVDDGTDNAIIDVREEPPIPEEPPRPMPSRPPVYSPETHRAAPPPETRRAAPPPSPPYVAPAEPAMPRGGRHGVRPRPSTDWQPVPSDAQWLSPGSAGTDWSPINGTPPAPSAPPEHGRHGGFAEPSAVPSNSYRPDYERVSPSAANDLSERHRPGNDAPRETGQHGEGQSVAELLARLQAGTTPAEGGRRRRRAD